MKLIIYPRLNTRSKRAMRKIKKQWGWLYTYKPRRTLIARLSDELGWTHTQVEEQIRKERKFIVQNLPYFTN